MAEVLVLGLGLMAAALIGAAVTIGYLKLDEYMSTVAAPIYWQTEFPRRRERRAR